jgi:RHS repeat-associated protein
MRIGLERIGAALLVLATVVPILPAQAAPADPFTGASQSFDAAPKAGINYNVGEWGVADQVGAATYTFAIPVPPGRNGMAPALALRYSSNSPLRGGIAAGWTLSLPTIEQDHALGVDGGLRYKAALGSAVGRLVAVPDDIPFDDGDSAYRVDFDDGFTRFFRRQPDPRNYSWTALTADGIKHHFSKYSIDGPDPRWRIEREEDPYGNTILYSWSPVRRPNGTGFIDYSLDVIEYASNAAAGLVAYARVQFAYEDLEVCEGAEVPLGAALRPGSREVDGARRLSAIRTFVRDTQDSDWRPSRHFKLRYEIGTSTLSSFEQPEVEPDQPPADEPPGGGLQDQREAAEPGQVATDEPAPEGQLPPEGAGNEDPDRELEDVPPPVLTLACKQNPLRYLTQIDIEAQDRDGTATKLPPITFDYNRRLVTTPQVPVDPLQPNAMARVEIGSPGFAQYGDSGRIRGGIQGDALDVDGDGIRDRISVVREDDLCKLVWRKGIIGGGFAEQEHEAALPTAPWYADWKGRPFNLAAYEGCTLNGQIAYRDYERQGEEFPAKGVVSYHFVDYTGDGRLDLLTNVWVTRCHWTYAPVPPPIDDDPCSFAPPVPLAAALPQTPGEPPTGSLNFIPMSPEEVAPGSQEYLWHVYPGVADPDDLFDVLAQPARSWPVRSPLPLPPSASDERLDTSATVQLSIPPLVDIDGDGFLDIVDTGDTGLTDCANELPGKCDWTVYFGDGARFADFSDAHLWRVPRFDVSITDLDRQTDKCGGLDYQSVDTTFVDLSDISGDGLPDLLVQSSDLRAYVNLGDRFSNVALPLNVGRAGERVQTYCAVGGADLVDGRRQYLRRLLDLDADGLLDMLVVGDGDPVLDIFGQHNLHARFNVGNRFGPSTDLPRAWEPGKRLLTADYAPVEDHPVLGDDPLAGVWHIATDFTDVTGDGLADLAEWDGETLTYISRPGLVNAPDLLSAVENGRGMRIEFSYAPSTDGEVVQWTGDGQPVLASGDSALLPQVAWVVEQVKVSGGFGTPAMTTRYRYEDPRYLSPQAYTGIPERSRFAGFRETIATRAVTDGPSHTVRKEYGYLARAADGRLVPAPNGSPLRELTYHGDDLHRAEQTAWSYEPLFDGEVQVALRSRSESCIADGAGVSVAGCLAMHNVRMEETWTGIAPSTLDDAPVVCPGPDPCNPSPVKAELYVRSAWVEGGGSAPAAGDRRTRYEHEVRYGQKVEVICPTGPLSCDDQPKEDDYRVRVRQTVREVADANLNYSPVGQTETVYSVAMGLPVRTREWVNADTIAETTRAYDEETGQLLSLTRPAQQSSTGGSGKRTTYEHDDHALFIRRTTNELGHAVDTDYDAATGVLLARRGPNSSAVNGTTLWDEERRQIDGLGRILARRVSIDDTEAGFLQHTVERITYEDSNFQDAGEPNRVRQEQLRDFDQDVWLTTEQTHDGIGRVLTSSQLLNGGDRDEITYAYDDLGNLAAVEVPDPQHDARRVRYDYGYDPLGRLTRFGRPDGSGLTIHYAGLRRTRCEAAADASGGCKQEVYDVFGRLSDIQELYPDRPPGLTRYQYDANDNLNHITNADGNVTILEHDWLSRRTKITRDDRSWDYVYDLNGNLTDQSAPAMDGEEPARQSTHYTRDDLDRVTVIRYGDVQISELPDGPFTSEEGLAGPVPVINTLEYLYDQGRNGIGRLSSVRQPFGEVQYEYDARGLVVREQRSVSLTGIADLGPISITQNVTRTHNALGQLTLSTWEDGSRWQIGYDRRGLVQTVSWFDPGIGAWRAVAAYGRTLGGLMRQRSTDYEQRRNFTYDALGRPNTDSVTLLASGAALVRRAYTYSGAGDLVSVSGQTNGFAAEAAYTYDAHHRLLTAMGPSGYQGEFSYSPAGNILTANVSWNGSDETRQVRYEYGAVDAQAVDRLVNLDEGTTHAQFGYDLAGHMTLRKTPPGETALTWNGLDQQRMAHGPDGAEAYFYDQAGMRVMAISQKDGVRFWFGESETHYSVDGKQTRRYLHLSDGGSTLARVQDGTKIELQYADMLQNLMLAGDPQGNVVASFLYGPFGEVVQAAGEEDHRRQFNGKENDALTGLRYYGYRHYDPLTLRWNSADPLYQILPDSGVGAPQRMNLYAFSMNNPIRYYDPDGRNPSDDSPVEGSDECTWTRGSEIGSCELGIAEEAFDEESGFDSEAGEEEEIGSAVRSNEQQIREEIAKCPNRACVEEIIKREALKTCDGCFEWIKNLPNGGREVMLVGEEEYNAALQRVWRQYPLAGARIIDFMRTAAVNAHAHDRLGPPNPNRIPFEDVLAERNASVKLWKILRGNFFGAVVAGNAYNHGYSASEAVKFGEFINNLTDFGGAIATPSQVPEHSPSGREPAAIISR